MAHMTSHGHDTVDDSEIRRTTWDVWNTVSNGINYHINWLAGFLNHQQYHHDIHEDLQTYGERQRFGLSTLHTLQDPSRAWATSHQLQFQQGWLQNHHRRTGFWASSFSVCVCVLFFFPVDYRIYGTLFITIVAMQRGERSEESAELRQ